MNIILRKEYAEGMIMKNLLSAHERIAREGNAEEVMRITNYALRLIRKREDKPCYVRTEERNKNER